MFPFTYNLITHLFKSIQSEKVGIHSDFLFLVHALLVEIFIFLFLGDRGTVGFFLQLCSQFSASDWKRATLWGFQSVLTCSYYCGRIYICFQERLNPIYQAAPVCKVFHKIPGGYQKIISILFNVYVWVFLQKIKLSL